MALKQLKQSQLLHVVSCMISMVGIYYIAIGLTRMKINGKNCNEGKYLTKKYSNKGRAVLTNFGHLNCTLVICVFQIIE